MSETSRSPVPARDALLTAARALLALFIGIMLFVAAFIGFAVVVFLTVGRAEVLARIEAAGAPQSAFALAITGFLLALAVMLLTARFLLELRRIVASVGEGDPFQPSNADRLRLMAWIAVVTQVVWLVLVAIGRWASYYLEGEKLPESQLGSGILLILVLFILARVFRVGSEMRAELEGTV